MQKERRESVYHVDNNVRYEKLPKKMYRGQLKTCNSMLLVACMKFGKDQTHNQGFGNHDTEEYYIIPDREH